jgi:hypothetical protein
MFIRIEKDSPTHVEIGNRHLSIMSCHRLYGAKAMECKFMKTTLQHKVFMVLLFIGVTSSCFAQVKVGAGNKPHFVKSPNMSDDSMELVRGHKIQVEIDTTEISQFEKIFGIPDPQLFQDEVPKHWVTVEDFYIDRYLVTNEQFKSFTDANPEWQPGRVPAQFEEHTMTQTQLEKVLYTAKDHTTGRRDGGASSSSDGRLNIKFSVPGRPGTGTNPEQLLAAGWSACFIGAMGLAAGKMTCVANNSTDANYSLSSADFP